MTSGNGHVTKVFTAMAPAAAQRLGYANASMIPLILRDVEAGGYPEPEWVIGELSRRMRESGMNAESTDDWTAIGVPGGPQVIRETVQRMRHPAPSVGRT